MTEHTPGSLDWWFADRTYTGAGPAPWVLAQRPNTPALVGLACLGARWAVPVPPVWFALGIAGRGALVWWGVEEARGGVNPFRQLTGAGVATAQLALLAVGL